jgi:uncharacterized membrane protein required for colicin V production
MGKMPFNWFDVLLVALLIVGIFRGRKRGMSQELMPLFKWVAVVLVCGFAYEAVAAEIKNLFTCSLLSAALSAYLGVAAIIAGFFAVVNRSLGGKIVGSDAFGKGEYYLGIFSGLVRYACVILFGLALLNARLYTSAEIVADQRYTQANYGSDFFPGLNSVQNQVFKESLVGPVIAKNLDFLLIRPTPAEAAPLQRKQLDLPM